ncbi:hypothetical protein [Parabacteroides sp. PF5-9]|uniref:hypothetical protein n=1 Tax=Parabacteroides sp. PF5-9 TaxID=1742404 RepID=UPI0024742734|nr:hypothetical protein [Parabacteroides sp. PF5-9]MDH6357513.1 hypothetical protein [Parabacteroides sp. PF5-9]
MKNIVTITIGEGASNVFSHIRSGNTTPMLIDADEIALFYKNFPEENKLFIPVVRGCCIVNKYENRQKEIQDGISAIQDQIKNKLGSYRMAIVLVGMGGYSSSCTVALIAEILNEIHLPAVYILSFPFRIEGVVRFRNAIHGLTNLQKQSSAIITFSLEFIKNHYTEIESILEVFSQADKVFAAFHDHTINYLKTLDEYQAINQTALLNSFEQSELNHFMIDEIDEMRKLYDDFLKDRPYYKDLD